MENPPREVIAAYFASIIFWPLLVTIIWFVGRRWERVRAFRSTMIGQWKLALGITVVYWISVFLSGHGFNPGGLAVFCQAWLGLSIVRSISNFEPMPVTESILRRERVANSLVLFIFFGLLAGVLGEVVGSLGMGIAQSIFHETILTGEIMQAFPANKFQAFFMFFAGAGIAEEGIYRLLLLSLFWALTKRRWLAVIVSALVSSAYHFTPLNQIYLTFLQFPISQFISGVLIGIVWGYVFVKRGYETSVLAHTMSDFISLLLVT